MCPLDHAGQDFQARLAQQAGLAPMGIRGLAIRAAADRDRGTPDRLLWLADLITDYGQSLRWENQSHRADDTQLIATLLRQEANRDA